MPIELATTEVGTGPPVVVLHGLFGSGSNWRSIAQRLAERHRVATVDLRNHGVSPWAEEMSYAALAEDAAQLVRTLAPEGAAVVGHSMGGKAAMMLALTTPALVSRLVVVDVAPVAYQPALLAYVQAMRNLDLAQVRRRPEADGALAQQIPEAPIRAFLLQNLVADGQGGFRWRLHLDALAGAMPEISGWPDAAAGRTYDGPTLFISGERSDYIRPEHWPAVESYFPKARLVTIPGAGHWVHAEQPERFLAAVGPFLAA